MPTCRMFMFVMWLSGRRGCPKPLMEHPLASSPGGFLSRNVLATKIPKQTSGFGHSLNRKTTVTASLHDSWEALSLVRMKVAGHPRGGGKQHPFRHLQSQRLGLPLAELSPAEGLDPTVNTREYEISRNYQRQLKLIGGQISDWN